MSMKCFQFNSRFIEFDVGETRKELWRHDKFACIRYLFDEANCRFAKGRNPSPFLAIDRLMKRSILTADIYLSSNLTCQNLLSGKPAKWTFVPLPIIIIIIIIIYKDFTI